ncbi:MAG: acetyl-CoA carboxylase biotin carboxyl carrier protein subunit [Deltaproteobacteria bacterium]|nr:acetyl-CoA carboxylase biotin carboxyl carrier protein subunit [Deltaproteobacteria bacterium]
MKRLLIDDTPYETEIPEKSLGGLFKGISDPLEVRAVIPGTVVKVKVRKGQQVSEGQVVLILEAMKMYNEVEANTSGKIDEINVSPGDRVETGQLMIRIRSKGRA